MNFHCRDIITQKLQAHVTQYKTGSCVRSRKQFSFQSLPTSLQRLRYKCWRKTVVCDSIDASLVCVYTSVVLFSFWQCKRVYYIIEHFLTFRNNTDKIQCDNLVAKLSNIYCLQVNDSVFSVMVSLHAVAKEKLHNVVLTRRLLLGFTQALPNHRSYNVGVRRSGIYRQPTVKNPRRRKATL